MTIAIYPGTFDPLTYGHIDIVKRAVVVFDKVVVAVAANAGKQPYFSLEERLSMCQEVFSDAEHVKIEAFDGLLVDFIKRKKAHIIVRGLRGAADLELEFQLSGMNKMMHPECETVFLKASETTSSISSSVVREIAAMGGDISLFVPPEVAKKLK